MKDQSLLRGSDNKPSPATSHQQTNPFFAGGISNYGGQYQRLIPTLAATSHSRSYNSIFNKGEDSLSISRVVILFRFGDTAMSHTKTRMEEAWTIEEVAFNAPGLSGECFIPPAELRLGSLSEACELPQGERARTAAAAAAYRAEVVALEKLQESNVNNIVLKMDI